MGKGKRPKAIQRLKMVPHRRESEVLANQLPELDLREVDSTVDHKAGMYVVDADRKRRNSKVSWLSSVDHDLWLTARPLQSDIEYESSK